MASNYKSTAYYSPEHTMADVTHGSSRISVPKRPSDTNLKWKHTTKPLPLQDTPLEIWNPPEYKRELFAGSFDNGNPGTKIQFRSLWEQTPAEPQEPPAQPGRETITSSLANFRLSVSVQLSHRVPLIFVTLLISYMRKQIVAQGCILLTVFGTGNFIIQALVKENKPWMSINIWSYLAARKMFIILITIFTVRGTWNVTWADEHGAARLQLQRVVPYSSSCSVTHGINKC